MDGELLQEVLSKWVPLLGAGLGMILGLVPMRDVLRCRRNKSLGQVRHDPRIGGGSTHHF